MDEELGDLKHLTLFTTASRLKHRQSKPQLKDKDVDLVYDDEDTIDYRPQERDFKHKQVPFAALLHRCIRALTRSRSSKDGP